MGHSLRLDGYPKKSMMVVPMDYAKLSYWRFGEEAPVSGPGSWSLLGFFCPFGAKTPSSILAFTLIAVGASFSEAVETAFIQLLSVNDWRDELSEADIAKG